VKGWYKYCMGLAAYDPSAWGNGGPPGTWHGGIAPQLGFLPPCLLASQSSLTFPNGSYLSPGTLKAKGCITREPLDDMGGVLAPMPPSFCWGPLSQTQVLGNLGQ
jgi:hypothetical protein